MAYRNYSVANGFTVDKLGNGDFTTIGSALSAAVSGDTIFIRPGTYTENPTLLAGVNLTATGSDSSLNQTGNVIINGNCTLSTAGSVTISGIELQTNSASNITVSGSAASVLNLNNCNINCSNNTGITFSSSSASAAINIRDCTGDLGTTGIKLFAHSSAGKMTIVHSDFTNSGASTTASTVSAGILETKHCDFKSPITTSGTATYNGNWTRIDSSIQNTTPLTVGGSGNGTFFFGALTGGTASACSIGATYNISQCSISSTNTDAVTGAGTFNQYGNVYTNTSNLVNTTTTTGGAASGLTQGTAPSAGFIGEQIRAATTSGSLSNSSPATIVQISLTAGVWDVTGVCEYVFTGLSTIVVLGISGTNNSITGNLGDQQVQAQPGSSMSSYSLIVPSFRITLSSSTTYYLVGEAVFSTGACSVDARISATRVG